MTIMFRVRRNARTHSPSPADMNWVLPCCGAEFTYPNGSEIIPYGFTLGDAIARVAHECRLFIRQTYALGQPDGAGNILVRSSNASPYNAWLRVIHFAMFAENFLPDPRDRPGERWMPLVNGEPEPQAPIDRELAELLMRPHALNSALERWHLLPGRDAGSIWEIPESILELIALLAEALEGFVLRRPNNSAPMLRDEQITVGRAAEIVDCSEKTIRRRLKDGTLRDFGGRVSESEVRSKIDLIRQRQPRVMSAAKKRKRTSPVATRQKQDTTRSDGTQ